MFAGQKAIVVQVTDSTLHSENKCVYTLRPDQSSDMNTESHDILQLKIDTSIKNKLYYINRSICSCTFKTFITHTMARVYQSKCTKVTRYLASNIKS